MVLFLVKPSELPPEAAPSDKSKGAGNTIVPHQQGVLRRLAESTVREKHHTEDKPTMPKPMPAEMALINSEKAWTMDRILTGALECAYSKLVTEARISDMAMRM